jgi:hypothetical protein
MLAYRVDLARAFDFEKNLSQPSRSSNPIPGTYVARKESWQRRLWAWPWKDPTKHLKEFVWAFFPRGLLLMVFPKLQPISYPPLMFGPKASSRASTIASGYFALKWKVLPPLPHTTATTG